MAENLQNYCANTRLEILKSLKCSNFFFFNWSAYVKIHLFTAKSLNIKRKKWKACTDSRVNANKNFVMPSGTVL